MGFGGGELLARARSEARETRKTVANMLWWESLLLLLLLLWLLLLLLLLLLVSVLVHCGFFEISDDVKIGGVDSAHRERSKRLVKSNSNAVCVTPGLAWHGRLFSLIVKVKLWRLN